MVLPVAAPRQLGRSQASIVGVKKNHSESQINILKFACAKNASDQLKTRGYDLSSFLNKKINFCSSVIKQIYSPAAPCTINEEREAFTTEQSITPHPFLRNIAAACERFHHYL